MNFVTLEVLCPLASSLCLQREQLVWTWQLELSSLAQLRRQQLSYIMDLKCSMCSCDLELLTVYCNGNTL